MTEPVTPDREALIRALGASMLAPVMGPNGHTQPLVDALLPLLTDALDRARQQGREDAAQAIEGARARALDANPDEGVTERTLRLIKSEWLGDAIHLARGADRKDEE